MMLLFARRTQQSTKRTVAVASNISFRWRACTCNFTSTSTLCSFLSTKADDRVRLMPKLGHASIVQPFGESKIHHSRPLLLETNALFPLSKRSLATIHATENTTKSQTNQTNDTNNTKNNNNDNSKSSKSKKTAGDVFLDNLGTIFLSAIGLLILSLVRSSKSTTSKTNLRTLIEESTAIDPFESADLRLANLGVLDADTFRRLLDALRSSLQEEGAAVTVDGSSKRKMTYEEFVSRVLQILKQVKGLDGEYTIQLGHLLDRVVLSLLEKNQTKKKKANHIHNDSVIPNSDVAKNGIVDESTITTLETTGFATSEMDDGTQDNELDVELLLVVLSLAMNGTVRERVEALYDIMLEQQRQSQQEQNHDSGNDTKQDDGVTGQRVHNQYIVNMVGYLQDTCQLVPDAQIVESETKYPVQLHRVGTPLELVVLGKNMKKDDLTDGALAIDSTDSNRGEDEHLQEREKGWTVDDFHHLLRSRSVCAWGECCVKKKGLN